MEIRTKGDNDGRGRFRAVILDYGAVLCEMPFPHEIERMSKVFGVTPAEFPPLYASGRKTYDRGDLSTSEYWTLMALAAGVELNPEMIGRLAQWDKEMWSRVNVAMRDWVASLRASGYRTALLSNMQFDMIAHIRANFPWLSDFDHQIFSAEVRAVKPDPAIYLHCLEKLGTQPAETVFVDDREENVAAARLLGITAFRFQSVAQLRHELAFAGFCHLP
jgi:putative hydrolase of the HAD superfamily